MREYNIYSVLKLVYISYTVICNFIIIYIIIKKLINKIS